MIRTKFYTERGVSHILHIRSGQLLHIRSVQLLHTRSVQLLHTRSVQLLHTRSAQLRLVLALVGLMLLVACGGGEKETLSPETTSPLARSPLPVTPATLSPLPAPAPTTAVPVATVTQVVTDERTARQLRVFSQLWETVRDTYVYPDYNGLDWDAVRGRYGARIEAGLEDEAFIDAMQEMIDELGDEHSGFYSPEEVAEEEEQLSGQLDYEGIGIYVTTPGDKVFAVLLHVFPDSPAERAGLQPHDRILKVDGVPVVDEGGAEHLDLLQGPVDSKVRLLVQTPGRDPRVLVMTREQIRAQLPVEAHRILETNVGYLLLPTFWDQTITERVRQALESLMAEGELDGLSRDLRTNGGGLLTEMEGTLAIFTEGELGVFASRDAARPLIVKADPIGRSQELPLVILVGRETESFGEVFSGVLQENGRAQVVGRTTYGNVETLWQVDLEDGSRAWIASEIFRPPSGADWEESGIIPDVEIPVDWDAFTAENDEQLRAALELLLQALGE